MAISNKKRKAYIDSLYTKSEQKQIKNSFKRYDNDWKEFEKVIAKMKDFRNLLLNECLILGERNKILKRHLRLSGVNPEEIIEKYRIPSKSEERILKIIHCRNK